MFTKALLVLIGIVSLADAMDICQTGSKIITLLFPLKMWPENQGNDLGIVFYLLITEYIWLP